MAAREVKDVEFSQIKNKVRRSALYQKEKLRKAKEKRDRKRKRKQEEFREQDEVSGDAMPSAVGLNRQFTHVFLVTQH